MSVAFGSPLTSANTNAAFVSRTQDTSMVGVLDNQNTTDSTATTNGAIHTSGGLGVEKKAHINQVYVNSLTGDKAVVTSASKEVVESVTTTTELSYVSGVTSSIQNQLNSKANDVQVVHNTGNETVNGEKTFVDDSFFQSNLTIDGNLTVNGTTTTVNSATLDVTDTNITVNNGGNDATSEGAGLTVERTSTFGSLVYEDALASKWKAGSLASESEVITANTVQNMTGNKTFSAELNVNGELKLLETIDSTTTGADALVPTTTPTVRLTNASLTSIGNIDDIENGKLVIISNETGSPIIVKNDSTGTAVKRILTGSGANVTLDNNKTLIFSYDSNTSRWMLVGGTGSTGDVAGPSSSVDSEIALFDSTTGKLIKRATGSGFVKASSGVYSTQASINLGTDVSSTLAIGNGGTGGTTNTTGFNNLSPNTTKGDLIVHNGTNNVRQSVGTDNYVLVADSTQSTGIKWAAVPQPAYPTVQIFYSGSGTYTTPANCRFLKVRMLGAGAGGDGSGTSPGSGSAGGNTTFGSSLLTANGGSAASAPIGGVGGGALINTPAYGIAQGGGYGAGYSLFQKLTGNDLVYTTGGSGGSSVWGGGGGGGGQSQPGQPGAPNSGGGGGGAGGETNQTNNSSGCGGGAGGYVEAYITGPSATYSYAVGAGGSGGSAGTGGQAGGAGGDGIIVVEEFY